MAPILDVLVQHLKPSPGVTGLCAGYDMGEWRLKPLALNLLDGLPSFALNHGEFEDFDGDTGMQSLRRAAATMYASEKYKSRGEFGELLLHVVLRQVFKTEPAVSKIYYKDSANDTVKGFDAVHVVVPDSGQLQLWLGEVKFYEDIGSAIRHVREELQKHLDAEYLRSEFLLVTPKVHHAWQHAAQFKALIDNATRLQDILPRIVVPVLLTYDSKVVSGRVTEIQQSRDYGASTEGEYAGKFESEIREQFDKFSSPGLPSHVDIQLILVPLESKAKLVAELDRRLKNLQSALD